jgi:predicted MPP superfamily phosphohydrolase
MRRFIVVIFGTLLAANLISWGALEFILHRLHAPDSFPWVLAAFFVLQILGFNALLLVRLFGYQPGTGLGRPLLSLIMIWNLLLAVPTAILALLAAIAWWLAAGANPGASIDPAWQTAGFLAVAFPPVLAFAGTAVALWQLGHFQITRLNLTIPSLPAALKGLTLVHLSDLHIGKLTRGNVLDDIVTATNRLEPDLVLVTGDLINMALEDLPRALDLLRGIKSRYGLFLCEGNHDLIESRIGFEAGVKNSGLAFLLNQSASVSIRGQTVQILGLRWGEGMHRAAEPPGSVAVGALDRLLAERHPDDFTILLAHHPEAFDAAAAARIPLTLSGHTHGGQLMFTHRIGFGPWLYRYWSGLYRQGDSQLVVSNGAGNWFPLRIHAPAEILQLTLN